MACPRTSPPADCYLKFAHELRAKCHRLSHVNGSSKLERKILAEVKFLKNLLQKNSEVQESHLRSSNLSHYAAIVHAAENLPGAADILQPFPCQGKSESLVVDVVAAHGHIWVKVIARKAQALHLVWAGQGQFGERDLLHQSEDYLDSARQHPHIYTTPDVYFIFFNNVTYSMAAALRDRGVKVLGHEVPVDENIEHKLMDLHLDEEEEEDSDLRDTVLDLCDDDSKENQDTGCCMMSAKQFMEHHGKYKEQKDKRQNSHSKDQHLHEADKEEVRTQTVTEGVTSSMSLSKEINPSTQEVLTSETKLSLVSGVEHPMSLCHETLAQTSSPSANTDSLSTTSANHLTDVCKFKDTEGQIDLGVPSVSIEGHTKSDLNKEELGYLQTQSENSQSSPWQTEMLKEEVSCVNEHASVPSSANYQMLMTELLGVIPDIANGIIDHSWDIINSVSKVNLDITTLITLVSAVTHGHCNYIFTEQILTMQAEEERQNPVLPNLIQFMKGKELYACRSAVDDFNTILSTLGGEGEKQRAEELIARVNVIEDNPSEKALQLKNLGKIKDRSKTIFGTGDSLKAITMTANSGFLRAAKGQGVSFAVFVHAARALTEDKEKTATPI